MYAKYITQSKHTRCNKLLIKLMLPTKFL